jgi:hypothetical protein
MADLKKDQKPNKTRSKRLMPDQVAYSRIETMPGRQAQVDWAVFKTTEPSGRTSTVYLFLMLLGYRRTALIIIDEAIHLMREKESNALTKKMDTLKSLANIHGTSIVLVGSYDLYKLMNQYGQVARRSTLVHFERYRSEKPDDVTAFTKSLSKLQKALPVEGEPDLTPFAKALMLPCSGCVGTLKDTLQRALNICLTTYKGKWSEKCLEKALLSKAQVTTILEEITDGEERIQGASFGCNSLTEK